MSILKRIFHKKEEFTRLDERIVWGIWVPRRLQLAYKIIAVSLRVPISVLVADVLTQWLATEGNVILTDINKKHEYGYYLTQKYLAKKAIGDDLPFFISQRVWRNMNK